MPDKNGRWRFAFADRRRYRGRVEAAIGGEVTHIHATKGVVLATGGFDWAPDYMSAYFRH